MGSTFDHKHDALVVGTGFGGLYSLYLLKQLGIDVRAIDSAADVGGTWYWNRYPGCRSDVESHVYRYSWDKDLLKSSPWKHNYLYQPEVLAYFQEVARKHDLYPLIHFGEEMRSAEWNDEAHHWTVLTNTGKRFVVRYLITAVGLVHNKYIPDFPGLDTFAGQAVHSFSWTPDIKWEGKRVAVIGSGASGVQIVSSISEKAKSLTHFIRHAQYVIPSRYRELSSKEREQINEQYDKIWETVFTSATAFGFIEPNRPAMSLSPGDREAIFERLWQEGNGFRFLFGGFSDLGIDEAANKEAMNFIMRKMKETVKDPQKADALTSTDWFARRPLTDDHYYERFNQDNVFAVNVRKTPISKVTPEGILTADGTLHPLDLIVFATGYDAIDGSYANLNIKGLDGIDLNDKWAADGPKTQLGVLTSKFPNLFIVNGPGAAFANNPPAAEQNVEFIGSIIMKAEDVRRNEGGDGVVEGTLEAERKWYEQAAMISDMSLFSKAPSWLYGQNIPGKRAGPRVYFGGVARYRAAVAEEKARGFPGCKFR